MCGMACVQAVPTTAALKTGSRITEFLNKDQNKHWHGAKKDSWFSHIAVEVPGEDTSSEWCEPVTEKEYCELEER